MQNVSIRSPDFVGWRIGELLDEESGGDSALSVNIQFYLQEVLLQCAHQVEHQVNNKVLAVALQQLVCHK